MASETQPPPTAASYTSSTTLSTPEKAHDKDTEAVERARSSISHDSDAGPSEKQENAPDTALERTQTSDSVYPSSKEAVPVIVALLLAIFLMALDRTIIATAIPRITDEFHSLDDIGWYGSAFLLTSAAFQLLLGRIYTFYTPKYIFLIIIAIFEVGSAICGAAPNSIAFIFGRAIAGVGAAGMMSGAVVLLVSVTPLKSRPKWMGLFGAMFGIASVVGPLLGGVFTTDVSWRWCFYINLPIGAVVMVIVAFILKPTVPSNKGLTIKQQLAKLDLLGEFFLLPCITCLLLALQWGGSTYAWSNGRIIALFTLFAALLVAFVLVQVFMQKTATVPARIIRNRSILGAMWITFCIASNMLLVVYYLPIWFQAIEGVSAVESGIRTLPLVLAVVVGSIGAGQFVARVGYYVPMMYLSALLMPIGTGLLLTLEVHSSEGVWIGYQILLGLGIGVGMQQGNMTAQTVLGRQDVPSGVALTMFCQMIGGAIFISVGQNILDTQLVQRLRAVAPGLTAQQIVNTGATELRKAVPASQLDAVLVQYNLALRQVFLVGVVVSCLTIVGVVAVEWRSVKGKQGPTEKKDKKKDIEAAIEEVGESAGEGNV